MNFKLNENTPAFIKTEVEKLKATLAPLLKKNFRYTMFSSLLISVSIVNLFFIIFGDQPISSPIPILLFAFLGALGFAISKEGRLLQKDILKISRDYILERINLSKFVTSHRKAEYKNIITDQPFMAMKLFIEFLNEEQRKKQAANNHTEA